MSRKQRPVLRQYTWAFWSKERRPDNLSIAREKTQRPVGQGGDPSGPYISHLVS